MFEQPVPFKAIIKYEDGSVYEGECIYQDKQKIAQGKGKLTKGKYVYDGEFKSNKAHG